MTGEGRSTSGPSSRSADYRRLWLLVFVFCVVIYTVNLESLQIGQHVDDGVYVSLGRSLISGLGYVRFEDPAHPAEPQYPPALAYLIAVVLALSGGSVRALRLIPLLFSLASLPLAYRFFVRRIPSQLGAVRHTWAAVLLALFGLNHLIVGYAGMIMTEAPFVFLTLAAIVWLDRLDGCSRSIDGRLQAGSSRPAPSVGWSLGMAALLALCCLMRTAAYAYVIAVALWLWFTRRRQAAVAVTALTSLMLIPWLVAQHQSTGAWFGGGYVADILGQGHTFWHPLMRPVENLVVYCIELLPAALLPFFGDQVAAVAGRLHISWLPPVMGLSVTGLVIAGAWWRRSVKSDPAVYLCGALGVVLLVWSYRYTRFCLPLVPLCLIYLLTSAAHLSRPLAPRGATPSRPVWPWLLAAITLLGFVARDVHMLYRPPRRNYTDLQAVARFVEIHTPAEATIITPAPCSLAVYTERSFVDLLPPKHPSSLSVPEPSELLSRTAAYLPRYVCIYPFRVDEPLDAPDFLGHPPFRLRARDDQLGAVIYAVQP